MKKLVAILFLFVIFFNLYGYRLVIDFIQSQKEIALVAGLDKDAYAADELISIKTAIALPYYTNAETYERVDGTITLNGIEYKYVKRRIYNDSLELLCLPNTAKQQLQGVKADFFKLANGHPATDGSAKATNTFKNILPDYCEEVLFYTLPPLSMKVKHQSIYCCIFPVPESSTATQPPDLHTNHC